MKYIYKIVIAVFIFVLMVGGFYQLKQLEQQSQQRLVEQKQQKEQQMLQEQQERQNETNDIIAKLDNDNLTEEEMKSILNRIETLKPEDGTDLNVLKEYCQAKYKEMTTREPLLKDRYAEATYYAKLIPDNYNGALKERILSYKKYIIQKNKDAIAEFNRMADEVGVTLTIGDPEQAVVEAYGHPIRINTTETANGTTKQYVYPDNNYVYVTNGTVTAIQH